jgi:hypothetical protein
MRGLMAPLLHAIKVKVEYNTGGILNPGSARVIIESGYQVRINVITKTA